MRYTDSGYKFFDKNDTGCECHQGDIIKFGRVRFKVKALRLTPDDNSFIEVDENNRDLLQQEMTLTLENDDEIRSARPGEQFTTIRSMQTDGLTMMNTINIDDAASEENANFHRFRA